MSVQRDLDTHELGVDDMDPVPVSQPDLGVDLDHATDGVVRLAQVQQVVVPQVPLPVRGAVEDCHRTVSQRGQHAALHVPAGTCLHLAWVHNSPDLHYGEYGVLESDGVDAALPLGHRAVHIDGARLGAQPHGRQHRGHLLHLGVSDLIVLRGLAQAVLDVSRGFLKKVVKTNRFLSLYLHKPSVDCIRFFARLAGLLFFT